MIKILIAEDTPSSNKGEAALLIGIIKTLQVFAQKEISLLSMHPEKDQASYGDSVKIIDARRIAPSHTLDGQGSNCLKLKNYLVFIIKHFLFLISYKTSSKIYRTFFKRKIWEAYVESDLILMCHDSFYAPFYHGPLLFMFNSLKKPVVLYGSTIIPPNPYKPAVEIALRNILNQIILKKASLITLRENLSLNYVKALRNNDLKKWPEIESYPDLAFVVDSVGQDELNKISINEKLPIGKKMIGMAISQRKLECAYPELCSIIQRREKALSQIIDLVDYFTDVLEARVVFVPHSIGPTPKLDDRIPAEWILAKAKNPDKIHVMKGDYTSQELKGVASLFEMTVGTRLHFSIDSVCMDVPALLITHKEDFRCHGIIGNDVGLPECLYNIESINSSELIDKAKFIWEKREDIKKYLSELIPHLKNRTMKHGRRTRDIYAGYRSGKTNI